MERLKLKNLAERKILMLVILFFYIKNKSEQKSIFKYFEYVYSVTVKFSCRNLIW